ncbi:MAG: DNA (cytosine-5-)-methyltransferase [Spirochaetes bacterium RBG_16_49_21]|nr:MAG: DNA (cytosine-5-)-methyltransferase [Spirochaetes bacterium RBG_16_49_21]
MSDSLVYFARQLRKNQTEAEKKLWKYLKSKQVKELKFRRQEPLGSYIVDFVCFENKLVIELDGSQHIEDKENDIERDDWLKSQGFAVIRFWNNEVMNNIDGVLAVIFNFCSNHPPLAPPIKGGGQF